MIDDDAARLVNMIISTWPAGVKGYVWTDVLRDLEQAEALEAYRQLRDGEERPPSVAKFLAAYHAARARSNPPGPDAYIDACELCDGTGWLTSRRAHNPRVCTPSPEQPCQCHAVEACRCSQGRRMEPVQASILRHNFASRRAADRQLIMDPRPAQSEMF
jgi:hypothetical protein